MLITRGEGEGERMNRQEVIASSAPESSSSAYHIMERILPSVAWSYTGSLGAVNATSQVRWNMLVAVLGK
jgi:hypothetical protein